MVGRGGIGAGGVGGNSAGGGGKTVGANGFIRATEPLGVWSIDDHNDDGTRKVESSKVVVQRDHDELDMMAGAYQLPKIAEGEMMKHLRARIQVIGPLAVADYVREVLTNPIAGYYMRGNVFGQEGDFTTSPEISQIFGELVGVWHVAQWMAQGSPKNVQLIELGPGRGTMMDDIMRTMRQFKMTDHLSLHMVEASAALSAVQQKTLKCTDVVEGDPMARTPTALEEDITKAIPPRATSALAYGDVPTSWHTRLDDVPDAEPDGYTMIIAHEFFDALPVNQFEYRKEAWRERLVDLKDEHEAGFRLRFMLSPALTGDQQVAEMMGLLPVEPVPAEGMIVEACLDAYRVCHEIRRRLLATPLGGTAMVVDYGDAEITKDTLRAFRDHKEVHVFDQPGTADLTADVNFGHIAGFLTKKPPNEAPTEGKIEMLGPITQHDFLHGMGIEARLQVLCSNVDAEQANSLKLQVHKLTAPEEMGKRFKFAVAIGSQNETRPPVAVFEPLE